MSAQDIPCEKCGVPFFIGCYECCSHGGNLLCHVCSKLHYICEKCFHNPGFVSPVDETTVRQLCKGCFQALTLVDLALAKDQTFDGTETWMEPYQTYEIVLDTGGTKIRVEADQTQLKKLAQGWKLDSEVDRLLSQLKPLVADK